MVMQRRIMKMEKEMVRMKILMEKRQGRRRVRMEDMLAEKWDTPKKMWNKVMMLSVVAF